MSAGCANCYAETLSARNPGTLGVWGPNGTRVVASESMWREPVRWDKAAKEAGERHRVFCASLADVFDDWGGRMVDSHGNHLWVNQRGPRSWVADKGERGFAFEKLPLTMNDVRQRLFDLIDRTPHLDWLLLTKRPENLQRMWVDRVGIESRPAEVRPNVWLGTSVENQQEADGRIPHLVKVPAAVRFLSCEPLLGSVVPDLTGVHWVIAGGESGPNARPMLPAWARDLRDQCVAAKVPFFFKQWGEYLHTHPSELHLSKAPLVAVDVDGKPHPRGPIRLQRLGKKEAGRLLDGREWNQFPK